MPSIKCYYTKTQKPTNRMFHTHTHTHTHTETKNPFTHSPYPTSKTSPTHRDSDVLRSLTHFIHSHRILSYHTQGGIIPPAERKQTTFSLEFWLPVYYFRVRGQLFSNHEHGSSEIQQLQTISNAICIYVQFYCWENRTHEHHLRTPNFQLPKLKLSIKSYFFQHFHKEKTIMKFA